MRFHPAGCVVFLVFLLLYWNSPGRAEGAYNLAYSLAVVPQFTPVDTGQRWAPLLARIQQESGIRLQLRVQDRYSKFEAELQAGVPDFAFINPYHAIIAHDAQGYLPLVRAGEPLSGVLVADREGPIQSLADINGRVVVFPAPNAFVASRYLRSLLQEKEGLQFTVVYAGTHQNVYRHVLLGEAAAGGGGDMTLERESPAVRSRLAVLYATPGVASHPLAAHPRVPNEIHEKLKNTLLKLGEDAGGRVLLKTVGLEHPQAADYARDYAPLKRVTQDERS